MRIGIVCYPTFGGSGVVATELGMALADKGHEVHFVTYNQPVRLDFISHDLHFHEVLMEEYPLFQYQPYELALSTKLVEVVSKYNLEILHVHYAIPHAYAAYMAKMMLKEKGINIKVVTTLHGTDITLVGSHPSYKTAVEFSINNSDVVTSVSESLKQDTLRLFKITNEIKVVHNFIDTEKYDRESLNECQRIAVAKPEERILTHISNFRPVKRIEDVIKIFHSVKKVISAKLLMVGEGPDKRKAELLVKKLGISDSVIFLGNSHEIEKILCYTDVFLLPSKSESFGLSALEAMAANTAIISTNTGGLPEVNVHGVTGYLSHLGDVEDMSKNTLNILKDDLTLSRFKINAKNHTNKFRLENILPIYENIYSSVLEKVL
ncbi:N-acetyl-alpha-D-glucosaminyl L-malate synthase BshA [Flavobacteriaceae bacterium]|jgi:N-acetyl-alpha-D-glucosaminyl L-malate synthase BshA|nr:N-acetyl-alpha-D-glucosaminyl L-malate synthase BshA [Flavobacteriaceae bacterium]MDB4496852.1 N-acetyl-alpha-D-glucosaminyl L-malate synthase BshA [Flavobacteriaceae bacterium]MDB4560003.1 N-acetyl-alpha-D-glucosaminyl L-malate synthase BshA [Flavobacteriaceae bacterium]MDC1167571.1 N-acetyl-alpha-D-glucosaminyl L-malate synthase BshA [Flavobacteriaceae bacterium]MDC3285269.1 N-acetyl-alpha-D-glucosaminyl L-malate synthase BshA [Flavobacteriaceae bacterium]